MSKVLLEKRALQFDKIAREYEMDGYCVELGPNPGHLPKELSDFSVDMVAWRDQEHVIVALRTHEELQHDTRLLELNKALHTFPGWSMDLIVGDVDQAATTVLDFRGDHVRITGDVDDFGSAGGDS